MISGGRAGGAIVGGVGGAVAGNAIAGAGATCVNQYGYYDANGVWVPNTATAWGYYGPDGRWVSNAPPPAPMAYQPHAYAPGPGSDVDVAYTGRDPWAGAPSGVRQREDWLEDRIRAAMNQNRIERYQGVNLLRDLHDVRSADHDYRAATGQLDPDQRRQLMTRLDGLNERLWSTIRHDIPDPRYFGAVLGDRREPKL